jgi:putative ABC transport system ATP-binding protein
VENVALPLYYQGVGRKGRTYRAERYLDMVGLSDRKSFLPNQLSGGQKQRVAIARALIGDPKILVADEPTGNLDSATGESIIQLFKNLAAERGLAILLTTHNAAFGYEADRVVTLQDGRIVKEEARPQFTDAAVHPRSVVATPRIDAASCV